MRIAMLSPIAWRTPPVHYGPWEYVVSILTEGLVEQGIDVTLYATLNSKTKAVLKGVCPKGYEEDRSLDPKVWESLHISALFEEGDQYDLIHNHFDFLPLTYSSMTKTPLLTTIHGFSSQKILPVYKKYNKKTYYVAISEADKNPDLSYIATIHHGIDTSSFPLSTDHGQYLLFFGRIHNDKGTKECIKVAKETGLKLVIAGIVQDQNYFKEHVEPHIDGEKIVYIGSVGPGVKEDVLKNAYALLHPINFDEPFGLSVVEAMACGTPVIAIKRGSMPELVLEGVTGFLVQDIDGMIKALEKVPTIDRRECRRWVEERFSKERMVSDYIKVYEEIILRHGKR